MATSVKMLGNPGLGTVLGAYGSYNPNANGTYIVDTKDAEALTKVGLQYLATFTRYYTTPIAPVASSSSATLNITNGAFPVTVQPPVPQIVTMTLNPPNISFNNASVAVTYLANDGLVTTDVLTVNGTAGVGPPSLSLTKGVVQLNSIYWSGLPGGLSMTGYYRIRGQLAVPISPGAIDVTLNYMTYGNNIPGTATVATSVSTGSRYGCYTVNPLPNGSYKYSFFYTYLAPMT